jgi:hypothetical protein
VARELEPDAVDGAAVVGVVAGAAVVADDAPAVVVAICGVIGDPEGELVVIPVGTELLA